MLYKGYFGGPFSFPPEDDSVTDDEVEDDAEVEGECEVCGELTTLHCNRCLFVVCSECECPNGCDVPPDANVESMTKLSDIGMKKP